MHSVSTEEGIILLQFQTLCGVLLVLHRGIARRWPALFAGLRTFQRDDDASAFFSHDSDS